MNGSKPSTPLSLQLTLSVALQQMGVSDADATVEIQIDFEIMQGVIETKNRHFGLNQIELIQNG